EHEYLLTLSSEKFLHEFYVVAGLEPPTAEGYGGWERSDATNFRGHAFGHYMSALAQSYASTRDATTKAALSAEITAAIEGLAEVQAAYATAHPESAGYVSAFRESALDRVEGTGPSDENVLVPWYILHKVLAGLLDVAEYVDGAVGDEAFSIATAFGVYVYGRVSVLDDVSTLLRTEYGGMNEALYELYDLTGDPRFETAAQAFDEVDFFRSLAAGDDVLSGRHANTTIPKLIGALKRYTVMTQNEEYYAALTQEEKDELPMYLAAAENFFQIVVDHHTYVTGSNSHSEHFHGPDTLYARAAVQGDHAQTSETCNEYNMLKLSRELFRLTKDVKYADYYENTFINTILSSQNPDTGMTTYFQPMAPGYFKVYAMPFTEFWCCWGTGIENFSKLGDSMYFTDRGSVYVNMFFSSTFDYGAQNLRLSQEANMPNDDTVRFTVEAIDGADVAAETTLRLRVPDWIAGEPALTVNGESVVPEISRGYLLVPDVAAGDVIEYTMPMEVVAYDTADNANFVAFKYGPVVLST
ncbi:MAG TPA: beta-L-arabinofuranosidase domain-containing protein, partial [Coriobacteriia bacterium]|nr:beta-L-arabinofuranosidase domain-containing protein [Coriobacteriia bacterium]